MLKKRGVDPMSIFGMNGNSFNSMNGSLVTNPAEPEFLQRGDLSHHK